MKVRNEIVEMIKDDTRLRRDIARELDVSEASISRYIRENSENGEFTKVAVVKLVSEHLKLPESLILEN